MAKFTSALCIDGTDLHVTLCFCDAVKSGKFKTSNGRGKGVVIGVEYWESADITVALIDSSFIYDRHEYYKILGYGYDYNFIPHATLSKGNTVSEHKTMKGDIVILCDEYARIY